MGVTTLSWHKTILMVWVRGRSRQDRPMVPLMRPLSR